ncbi:neuromedin U receptor homolog nmur-2-like [Amphiura filiformis]|uniref:neuromedin U receptor homolog nmur-2-like n=1 Tax=Amphiura filiformis TaxID=82378 RepID=UPI003B22138E
MMFLGFVPLIFTFGLFWNLALLFVVYRVKSMRNTTNFYLSNLAVSDAALLVTGGVHCLVSEMAIRLFYYASVFIIWLVTYDRYLAICHPMKHLVIKGKRRTVTMIVAIWIISSLMSILAYPYKEVVHICVDWPDESQYRTLSSSFPRCGFAKLGDSILLTWQFLELGQFTLAVVTCTYMFIRITYTLSTRSNPNIAETSTVRNQIARMLILNGTVFFLCLVPFQLTHVNRIFLSLTNNILINPKILPGILWLGRVTMLINSSINPILYNVSNATYRAAFAEAFGRKKEEVYFRIYAKD